MDKRKIVAGHLMACVIQLMWGATFISTKVLVQVFLPVEVLFMRVCLALAVMFLVWPRPLKVKNWRRELLFVLAGLTGIVFYFLLENTALTYAYASTVGIIVACAPFFVAVVVGIFFKSEQLRANFFIGFAVSMIGIAMISLTGQEQGDASPVGALLAVLAMVSWGFYSAIVKKIEEWEYPVIPVTRRIYGYAAIFLLPVCLFQHATFDLRVLAQPKMAGNILFLGICGSALGFMLWNLSTKLIGAIKTSVYIYLSPVMTLFLSVLVLGERMTVQSVIGTCLIFAGLLLSQGGFYEKKND